jgi:hypothetical protein
MFFSYAHFPFCASGVWTPDDTAPHGAMTSGDVFLGATAQHIRLFSTVPPWPPHKRELGLAALTATGQAFLMLATSYKFGE